MIVKTALFCRFALPILPALRSKTLNIAGELLWYWLLVRPRISPLRRYWVAVEIVDKFNFKQHTNGKTTVLFFWPMDFTFVCPSELIAFDKRYEEFQKRGVEVVGVSFDSEFVHNAWRNTPVDKGGIGPVKYAMVADVKREIQKAYGIEHPDEGVALRGSFLIDANGIVRHQVVNDLPLGRNIDEMLRMVDALQFHEEHGDVCPAQWEKGKEGMNASPDGVAKYLAENISSL
ncbi:peroxidase [Salmonella enterica subsp. enterica serovar Typhimurium]|nr:peroxidase [Salmonella enterica subsp. enterica serovar Typhimurium]